jgi:hypothetical protein
MHLLYITYMQMREWIHISHLNIYVYRYKATKDPGCNRKREYGLYNVDRPHASSPT